MWREVPRGGHDETPLWPLRRGAPEGADEGEGAAAVILSPSEIKQLTGYAQSAAQMGWLKRWGVEFTQNFIGTVIVKEEHLDAALDRQAVPGIPPGEETPEDIHAYKALRKQKPIYYSRRDDPKPRRTPAWADVKAIDGIYAESRRLSAETGIRHSVDHIIPLCGRTVTGLHVETNLRIITLEQNIRKGNRWDPT